MKGRRDDVDTSPSPFSSLVSLPPEVDGLSQIWSLPGICYGAKWTVRSHTFPGIDVNLVFLHIMFSSVFESVSLATTRSRTMC